MSSLDVLIVDDEPIARRHIRRLLQRVTDLRVVGECGNGGEAIQAIREKSPQIIFLDVQMPGLDGFRVLEELHAERLPLVIFTTAYDQYAVRAFEVHALDYLLKPFDDDRFYEALDRARGLLAAPREDVVHKLVALVEEMRSQLRCTADASSGSSNARLERVIVKSAGRITPVKVADIERIKAANQYLELKVGDREHLVRQSMDQMESMLDPGKFMRIHRSVIVNIDCVRELQPWGKSQYAVILRNGERFVSSRGYRNNLQRLFKGLVRSPGGPGSLK
ncbi:MAG: LytTR family DNA-binding domain-containing protein [Acidobacteriota bacterium]